MEKFLGGAGGIVGVDPVYYLVPGINNCAML
jgi:hypothetical protein